jgi:hypothetical protein
MSASTYIKTVTTAGHEVTRTVTVDAGDHRVLVVTRDGNHAPSIARPRSGPADEAAAQVAEEIGRDLEADGYIPDRRCAPLSDDTRERGR